MKIKIKLWFASLGCLLLFPWNTFGFGNKPNGIGEVASNLLEPVNVVTSFVVYGAQIAGACFIMAAFFRYMKHRVNPLEAPFSSVVILLLIGLILFGLPFAYKLL